MLFYWAMMLSVSGMYTMYMAQMGFSKKDISIAVTIMTFSTLIGQNLMGYLVDKFRGFKRIMIPCISVGIVVAIALMYARAAWQINILIFLWGFFLFGTVPLSEAWCIEELRADNALGSFGKIRGMGSVGYGFSGVLIGLLLQNFGWKIYYWYIMVFVGFTLLVISVMREEKRTFSKEVQPDEVEADRKLSLKEGLREIFKIKPLRAIILIVFMYTFTLKGIYNYLGVLVGDYGGGPLSLGLTYFCDATPEVITFFLASRLLRKFQSKKLILIAFFLQIVRLSLILIFNSALAIILLGILSGFAYGLLAASYKTYIYELAPEHYKASCLSLSESIIGLSGVISVPIFGFVFTQFGGSAAMALGLAIDIISVGIILKDSYEGKTGRKVTEVEERI